MGQQGVVSGKGITIMDRRDFLKTSAIAAVGLGLGIDSLAAGKDDVVAGEKEAPKGGRLIVSAPMLQNFAETSIGVAFAVSAMANGYVTYGLKPDLSDGRTVKCGGFRVTDMNDKVMLVRLTGLQPSTKYYYRIGADRINYVHGHKISIEGSESGDRIYSFRTAGPGSDSHFCVINDTHSNMDALELLYRRIDKLGPACLVCNGDMASSAEDIEKQISVFLNPDVSLKDYAAERPCLLCPGNHENRGLANRHLERVWMFRQPEERSSRDWDLGRNFAVRLGEIAIIGLDTAEDKVDSNPRFCGLFNSEAYRVAQKAWLEDALNQPEISSAPYLVACCHIPLYDSRSNQNPGDVHPDDTDPRYETDYAHWQRTCKELWSPLLEKAGCQLVISGHQHKFRYEPPCFEHNWAEIIGGGPDTKGAKADTDYPTLIDVKAAGGSLKVKVINALTNKKIAEYKFDPKH